MNRRSVNISVALMIFLMGITLTSIAHAVVVPRSVEADTVKKSAEESATPVVSAPQTEGMPTTVVAVPKGAEKVKFVLKSVRIEGSTVYTQAQLAENYKDLIGRKVSLADIYVVVGRITERYMTDGYLLCKAYLPPQKIEHGHVTIHVVEGYVSHIRWEGDRLDSTVAKGMADKLLAARPLKGPLLEEVALKLNDLPGVQAKTTLAPAADGAEGAVDLVVTVIRKRISGQLDINDYASRYLGTWQTSLLTNVSGVISAVDNLSFNLSSSLNYSLSHYGRVEYDIPVNAQGLTLKAGTSLSTSAPGYHLLNLDIQSRSTASWFGISEPVIRSRAQNLTLGAQFNINNQYTDILYTPLYADRTRTLQLTATYNKADNWGGINNIEADIFKGLNILDATHTGTAMLSRQGGHSDFLKFTFSASRLQAITDNISLLVAATGQASNDPLLSSDQFGFGGPSFGRAYDLSEISGDQGIAASLELRYNNVPLFQDVIVQPYAFYDIGEVYSKSPGIDPISAASAGFGLRTQAWGFLHNEFFIAWPLTYTPGTPKLGEIKRSPRFGISMTFMY